MSWGLEDVTVQFGSRTALANVSLAIESGAVAVVVGGDGAGKTTALRALVGLVPLDAGRVRRPAKERIGYVPATVGLYTDLTVEQNLSFAAASYGITGAELQRRETVVLERIGLERARKRLGLHLSGGMMRKLAVGMALVHSPDLLVLDEPTTGVDPVSRVELWRLISAAAASGASVVVTTTYVNEAERGTSAALLESGRVLASGSPDDLVRSVPGSVGRAARGAVAPTDLSWRRGAEWRIWSPGGQLPPGVTQVEPDIEDAAVVAALAAEAAG